MGINKKASLVGSIICLTLGVLFILTYGHESFGDKLFHWFQLPAWSNGTSGFHYSNFMGFVFVLPVFLITRNHQNDKRVEFVRRIAAILLLLITLSLVAYFIV
ncbi:MAG: hypothetical protein HFE75_02035 [Firmicutes bacterium]|nr:hypothetical protein [Bacillota bacterium]NBI62893.1 hypothetical protein [Clostridiales bacterium]